jgi:hypothetical protein
VRETSHDHDTSLFIKPIAHPRSKCLGGVFCPLGQVTPLVIQHVLRDVLQLLSMEKTITIRLGRAQDEALTRRAKTTGKTRSAVVRELLEQALLEIPISEKAAHLKGSLRLEKPKDAWGKHLRKQNWRSNRG